MSGKTAVLFVHGSGGNASVWDTQVEYFANTRTVRAIDLPGRRGDVSEVSLATCVKRLGSHVRALDRPVVVGHSLGAAVTLEFALENPEMLSGLVLIGAATSVDVPAPLIEMIRSDFDAALQSLPRALLGRMPDHAAVQRLVNSIKQVPVDAFVGDLRTSASFDFEGRLEPFRGPVLVIQGAEDRVTGAEAGGKLAAALGGAFEEVAGSGHMVMMERPAALNGLIESFLDRLV